MGAIQNNDQIGACLEKTIWPLLRFVSIVNIVIRFSIMIS